MYHHVLTAFDLQNHSNEHAAQDSQVEAPLDVGGDTDPATDVEETPATVGAKRKAGSAGLASK